MSILGSFIGAVLAVPFAVAAASNIVTNRVVVFLVRLFLSLVRTLPKMCIRDSIRDRLVPVPCCISYSDSIMQKLP